MKFAIPEKRSIISYARLLALIQPDLLPIMHSKHPAIAEMIPRITSPMHWNIPAHPQPPNHATEQKTRTSYTRKYAPHLEFWGRNSERSFSWTLVGYMFTERWRRLPPHDVVFNAPHLGSSGPRPVATCYKYAPPFITACHSHGDGLGRARTRGSQASCKSRVLKAALQKRSKGSAKIGKEFNEDLQIHWVSLVGVFNSQGAR